MENKNDSNWRGQVCRVLTIWAPPLEKNVEGGFLKEEKIKIRTKKKYSLIHAIASR